MHQEFSCFEMSDQINEITKALVSFQSELTPVLKDSSNPFFRSKYADLDSIWDEIRPLLAKNGLAVIQPLALIGSDGTGLVTIVSHISGQWFKGQMPLYLRKKVKDKDTGEVTYEEDPQSQGSAITYARRYAMSAMLGITQTDDDGNAASGRSTDSAPRTQGSGMDWAGLKEMGAKNGWTYPAMKSWIDARQAENMNFADIYKMANQKFSRPPAKEKE